MLCFCMLTILDPPPKKREFMFVSAEALAMNHETKMCCFINETT